MIVTINCRGKLLDLAAPKVMGILNINADSFYAASRVQSASTALKKAERMMEDGAAMIDVGAMSSRPGAPLIEPVEEWSILQPVLDALLQINEIIISVDTVWSYTAQRCLDRGAHLINDISASSIDPEMMQVVASYPDVPYIMMHMRGKPETMASMTHYDNLVLDVLKYFSEKIRNAENHGIRDLILDPGFGFSKTKDQSFELLRKLGLLTIFDRPLLAGLSRKSMLYKSLGIHQDEALNATTAANVIALVNGARLLRVHDVKEAVQACHIFSQVWSR